MRWNLDNARAILPEVRRRTGEAVARVEALSDRRLGDVDPAERVEIEQELARVVSVWIRGMEALGVDVKGAWLVDFDTGSGCYCWRWPEARLEYFHGYHEGFAGRVRIQ
jgi:hypothetical protein